MSLPSRIKQTWEILDESWQFAITAFLIARTFYGIWSWVVLTVQPVAVHYVEVEEQPAVLFLNLHTNQTLTYLRHVEEKQLTFRSAGLNLVTDLQTGTTWNINSGRAEEGFYKGQTLTSVKSPEDMFSYFSTKPYPVAWLALWQRFDANWYTTIAEQGYGNIEGDDHYPPIYPLLIRILTPFTGNTFIAGLLITHLATLYTLKLLVDTYNEWGQTASGKTGLGYFLLYPTSFYLFSAYSESVFLVFALLAMHCMKTRSWAWAGFWVFCATSTRLQGAALFAPMTYLMWQDRPFIRKLPHWAGLIFAATGILFYLFMRATLASQTVVPFSEPAWHARLALPWETYFYAIKILLSGKVNYIDFLNWFIFTLFLILLFIGWRKIPLEYNLYTAFSLLIILTRIVDTRPLISMLRYAITLFPVFFIIGLVNQRPRRRRIVIYTCMAFTLYLSAQFFGWGWVA